MQTEPTKTQNVYKLWLQPTISYKTSSSDRSWQVKLPKKEPLIAAPTNPIFGKNPVLGRPNLTDRNLRRLTNKKEKVPAIHWAVINGMEPSDVKKVQNARKQLRRNRG